MTGSIVAREEAAAGTDLNGMIVLQLNADEGDTVKKGDVLAVLDRSALDTQLAQVNASRAQAEATIAQMRAQIGDAEVGVRQAQEALDRAKALQLKGVAAKMQLDNAVNGYDSAQAKLLSANKAVAASEAQLAVIDAQKQNILLQIEKTEVKAPADGLVLARNATLGGIVSAGGDPLFRIAIGGELETGCNSGRDSVAASSARHAGAGHPGRRSRGRHRHDPPHFAGGRPEVAAGHDPRLIDRQPRRARRKFRARSRSRRCASTALPFPYPLSRSSGTEAFVQVGRGRQGKDDAVTLGARADGHVQVSGIAEGQEVVARAGTFVGDGDAVTPVRGKETGAIKP